MYSQRNSRVSAVSMAAWTKSPRTASRPPTNVRRIPFAVLMAMTNPARRVAAWSNETQPDAQGRHANALVPSKFQPQPNGSDRTGRAYERLAKTKDSVKASYAASPRGTKE
jgi:hypothetical protein